MSTPARERSAFGQFQLNRSGIGVGVDYTKVKRTSTGDMAEMLRDGATKAEVCEAFGLSRSAVNTRLVDSGWSSATGQPLGASPELDPEQAPDAPARIPQYRMEFVDQPWVDQALCAETDPEMWFPEKGGVNTKAKTICAKCFAAAECLDWALTTNQQYGIWGGLSKRERSALTNTPTPERTAS